MQVPVNQNFDEFKDDFYKGLTLRQTVISVVTVVCGVLVYMLFFAVLGLGQTVSLYLTLPVIFPIAAYGFLKVHGMNVAEYARKKRAVQRRSDYTFIPQILLEEDAAEPEPMKKRRRQKGRKERSAPIYLQTEESLDALLNEGRWKIESNERLPGKDAAAL